MDGDIYWPITTLRCGKVWAQHELKTMTVDAYKGRKDLCTRVFNKMRKYRGEDDFLLLLWSEEQEKNNNFYELFRPTEKQFHDSANQHFQPFFVVQWLNGVVVCLFTTRFSTFVFYCNFRARRKQHKKAQFCRNGCAIIVIF